MTDRTHIMRTANGIDLWYSRDQSTDEITVHETMDAEPIRDKARAIHNDSNGWTPEREMLHLASIPPTFITKWSAQDGVSYLQLHRTEFWRRCKRKIAEQGLDDFLVNKGRTAFRAGYQPAESRRRFSLGRTAPTPKLIV